MEVVGVDFDFTITTGDKIFVCAVSVPVPAFVLERFVQPVQLELHLNKSKLFKLEFSK